MTFVIRISNEALTTSTLCPMIGRRADSVLTAEEVLARVFAEVDVVGSAHANGVRRTCAVAIAFVWYSITTNSSIARSSGEAFFAGTRNELVISGADGVRSAQISTAAVDTIFDTVLIQLTYFDGLAVGI